MATAEETEWLRKRLDMVIQLLLEISPGGAGSTTKKIERLLALGFTQPEVAQVVGKKLNYVTAVVAGLKKSANTRKTKSGKSREALALPAPDDSAEDDQ